MGNIFAGDNPSKNRVLLFGLLCISSCMSVLLVGARAIYTGELLYTFLVWNLFLAWLPLFAAITIWYLAERVSTRSLIPIIGLAFLWFLFFPNAPYLVTDFVHFGFRPDAPFWYDLLLIFSFAWNGLTVGFVSLRIMQGFIERQWGSVSGWSLVLGTLALSGFGIYLGRFLRWNSWDFFTNPSILAIDIVQRFADPLAHPRTFGVTILYSSFLLISYITIVLFTETKWQR